MYLCVFHQFPLSSTGFSGPSLRHPLGRNGSEGVKRRLSRVVEPRALRNPRKKERGADWVARRRPNDPDRIAIPLSRILSLQNITRFASVCPGLFSSAAEAGPRDILKMYTPQGSLVNISNRLESNRPDAPYRLELVAANYNNGNQKCFLKICFFSSNNLWIWQDYCQNSCESNWLHLMKGKKNNNRWG